jgi:hypothetical protein
LQGVRIDSGDSCTSTVTVKELRASPDAYPGTTVTFEYGKGGTETGVSGLPAEFYHQNAETHALIENASVEVGYDRIEDPCPDPYITIVEDVLPTYRTTTTGRAENQQRFNPVARYDVTGRNSLEQNGTRPVIQNPDESESLTRLSPLSGGPSPARRTSRTSSTGECHRSCTASRPAPRPLLGQ